MHAKTLTFTWLALSPAALLLLTSCSSNPPAPESTSSSSYQHGVPGGVRVDTHKMTAKVTDIDAATRQVTLVNSDGEKVKVKCGPDIINFDQIKVGDHLKVTVTEEIVAYLADAGAAPNDRGAAVLVLAPQGAKPGGMLADTVQLTAKVSAINLRKHKATLEFADGTTRTVAVRPDVDLTQRHVGEAVVIRMTELMVVNLEKP